MSSTCRVLWPVWAGASSSSLCPLTLRPAGVQLARPRRCKRRASSALSAPVERARHLERVVVHVLLRQLLERLKAARHARPQLHLHLGGHGKLGPGHCARGAGHTCPFRRAPDLPTEVARAGVCVTCPALHPARGSHSLCQCMRCVRDGGVAAGQSLAGRISGQAAVGAARSLELRSAWMRFASSASHAATRHTRNVVMLATAMSNVTTALRPQRALHFTRTVRQGRRSLRPSSPHQPAVGLPPRSKCKRTGGPPGWPRPARAPACPWPPASPARCACRARCRWRHRRTPHPPPHPPPP